MRSRLFPFVLLLLLAGGTAAPVRAGELTDHGPGGLCFHDADSGLYWFDPVVFQEWARETVDAFAGASTVWQWATSTQIDALVGQTSPGGQTLEDVMGGRQSTLGDGSPRWLGFYAETSPQDGWLVQAYGDPTTISSSSGQGGTAGLTHGAWLVAATDPLLAPRIEDYGDNGEFFVDHATSCYWMDPVHFVGMTRTEIEAWLVANPDWRWASQAEILALSGRLTVGDVPLTDVMGAAQYMATGDIPRWIGYYDLGGETQGINLQAGGLTALPFPGQFSTQGSVAAWNPGAWILTESEPAPAVQQTLGGIKTLYR